MVNKGNSRRKYLQLEAASPGTQENCVVRISFDRMQAVARRSLAHVKECGNIVPFILQHPTGIFEGLRRDEDKRGYGWRCYCGIPEVAYHSDGTPRSTYPGQIYVVFVNDDGVAYNWRWEKCDPDDFSLPIDYQKRFKK